MCGNFIIIVLFIVIAIFIAICVCVGRSNIRGGAEDKRCFVPGKDVYFGAYKFKPSEFKFTSFKDKKIKRKEDESIIISVADYLPSLYINRNDRETFNVRKIGTIEIDKMLTIQTKLGGGIFSKKPSEVTFECCPYKWMHNKISYIPINPYNLLELSEIIKFNDTIDNDDIPYNNEGTTNNGKIYFISHPKFDINKYFCHGPGIGSIFAKAILSTAISEVKPNAMKT